MSVTNQFSGFPLEPLVSAPTIEDKIVEVSMVKVKPNSVVMDSEAGSDTPQVPEVEAPLLKLVRVPALNMETMPPCVLFDMEVKESIAVEKASDTKEAGMRANFGIWGLNVQVSGKVTVPHDNIRNFDQSAKYEIYACESQRVPAEGMAKLSDIFASAIEPVIDEK